MTGNVRNARGGFGYAQPPVYEQVPKQVQGDRVGKCHAKDVRVKPEHDKAALAVAE